jgi:hypothetical protein
MKVGSCNKNAFISTLDFYLCWSGRFVVNYLLFVFMKLDNKWIFNICNSFVYLVFSWSMYALAVGKNKNFDIKIYLFSNLLLWYFFASWGECILWFNGSFQYLWAAFFYLLFLVPYRFQLDGVIKFNCLTTIGMFFLGIAAGCSGENAVAAILIALSLYILYKRNKKIPFEPWELVGVVGFLIGFIVLIACPGSYVRAKHFDIAHNGIAEIIKYNFMHVIFQKAIINHILIIMALFIGILLLYWRQDGVRKSFMAFGYVFLAFVAHFSMIASPIYPIRTTMPVVCFCIIAVCDLAKRIDYSGNTLRDKLFKAAYVCFILCFPKSLYLAIKDSYVTAQSSEKITEYILSEKAKGRTDIIVDIPVSPRNDHTTNNISSLWSDHEKNLAISRYFGVNFHKNK